MKILEYMESEGHEQLLVCSDPSAGLKAFIAIHDTTLGPGLRGMSNLASQQRRSGH